MKKLFLCLALTLQCTIGIHAVEVELTTDEGFDNPTIIQRIQSNLAALLTEINDAYDQNRDLNLGRIAIHVPKTGEADVKDELATLWDICHFHCDDSFIKDRCWQLRDGFFVRQIPMILDPDGDVIKEGKYQEVSVSFDRNGSISEFRFGLDAGVGQNLDNCAGDVASVERRNIIKAFVERFATAYHRKDIDFMNKVFSDDALIVTGTVIMTKPNDSSKANAKVIYNRQNKQQYLAKLRRAFAHNKYIDVKLDLIDNECAVTHSQNNPNVYGVRLFQEWRSSNYNDDGYVFILWDFRDENNPEIKVRTWQPTMVGTDKKIRQEDIFTIDDVEEMIQ